MRAITGKWALVFSAAMATQACAAPADDQAKKGALQEGAPPTASSAATPAIAPENDPLLKPIAPDYAKRWLTPTPPTKIYGNSYLVGFGDLNVGLISTSEGLILLDGAVPQAVPDIKKNIEALGFKVSDIKYILNTESHYDHSGGLAALSRDSGAPVLGGVETIGELQSGQGDVHEPQGSSLETFPAIRNVRGVRDGETITLGDVTVTAVATPGHTLGSRSWTWQSCEGKECKTVVFSASLNPAKSGDFRFTSAAGKPYVDALRGSFAKVRAMPCDILITAHPSQSDGAAKLAKLRSGKGPNPFVDANACKTYAASFEKTLAEKLAKEAVSAK